MKTAKYYLYMVGPGEGCDYTIGCNSLLKPMKAQTYEEVLSETMAVMEYYGGFTGREPRIENAYIVEAANVHDLKVPELKKAHNKVQANIVKAKQEAEELAQYEKLKAKFDR